MFESLTKERLLDLLYVCPPLFPPCADREAWQAVQPVDREEIVQLYEAWKTRQYPFRSATGFLDFVRTGSRQADEAPYFDRRRKLCISVLACCVGMDALDDVIDGIWCISEETGWVISAHNRNPVPGAPGPEEKPLPDPDDRYIDLFAAQTGMILSLTLSLLGSELDAVSPMIRARILRELRRRILQPFLDEDDFWWMGITRKDLNNWTPWIISGILWCAAVISCEPEELASVVEKALIILDRWLLVVPSDGGCDEGTGYWNMAGGALLDALEVLERLTDGAAVFWQDEKLRRICTFPMKMELGEGYFVNFADCDARPFLSGERLQYAGEKLGDGRLADMGGWYRGTVWDQLKDVPHFGRALQLLFHVPPEVSGLPADRDAWLEDLQVRIVRRGEWTLCCKGGHNGESHNHNDVGSFILCLRGRPEIVDAGNMVYTAKTFSADRYSLWNTRSAFHNLPIIGDGEQRNGENHRAAGVRCLPDGLTLDMAAAYDLWCVEQARRSYRLTEHGLLLRDEIRLTEALPVTFVFMLRHRPEPSAGFVRAGPLRLIYPDNMKAVSEEIPMEDVRMARSFPGSLWRLLLKADAAECFDAQFEFTLEDAYESGC